MHVRFREAAALVTFWAAVASAGAAAAAPGGFRCETFDDGAADLRPLARTDAFVDTEHFRLHYATSGQDIIAGWPDPTFRDALAGYLETAYRTFRDDPAIALPEPVGTGPVGATGRPLIEVYVVSMYNYGEAHLSHLIGGTCVLANAGYILINNHFDGREVIQQARLTSAHELFHLVQAAARRDGRFFEESTANWSELHVWPDDHGFIGEGAFLHSPYLAIWDATDSYRPYGAAIFWYFLDRILGTASGRYPAAEIVSRTCDVDWDPALADVVAEAGADRCHLYHEFAVWNYYTGSSDDGRHYEHGEELSTVLMQGSHSTYPVVDVGVLAGYEATWTGSNYLRFWGRASRERLRVEISGDPAIPRRATAIGTVRPNTHVQFPTRMPDADGRVELLIDDWNLYDMVTVVLTNPDSVAGACLDYTYSAYEEGRPVVDLPWEPSARTFAFAPNPSAAGTFIRFDVTEGAAPTSLEIVDVAGRRVRSVVDGALPAGTHNRVWDGRDDAGRLVAGGTYLLVLRNGANRTVTKLTVLR